MHNIAINDLVNSLPVYVEIDGDSSYGKIIDVTTMSNHGTDCPCCGNIDSIISNKNGYECNECPAKWYLARG